MAIKIDYVAELATNEDTNKSFPLVMSRGEWCISVGNLISLEDAGIASANFSYWEDNEPYASELSFRILGNERWVSINGWLRIRNIVAMKRRVKRAKYELPPP